MKLFKVEVTRIEYVLAEDAGAAEDYAAQVECEGDADTFASEVTTKEHSPQGGWDERFLVWPDGSEVTLGEALAALPSREGGDE